MSKVKKVPGVEPSEGLVPKLTNPWLLMALLLLPLLCSMPVIVISGSSTSDAVMMFWLVVLLVLLLTTVVCWVIAVRLVITLVKKLSAANRNIAESIQREYGFTVVYPKAIILTDRNRPRLNPHDIEATDTHGRQVYIRISPDETGTRVVASLAKKDPAGLF